MPYAMGPFRKDRKIDRGRMDGEYSTTINGSGSPEDARFEP